MTLQGFAKCLRIFFIVFLLCPKRTRLSAAMGKQQEYIHAVRRSQNEVIDPLQPNDLWRWWQGHDADRAIEEDLLSAEPGFDLDDEEIRKFKLWPKGIIPYYIDVVSFNDKVLRDRIRSVLNVVNSVTMISFQEMPGPPKDDKTRWVFFVNRRGQLGCADHSIKDFTNEGVQQVILGYDCLSTGGELAEAVLALAGVPPQHNSPDRDSFIKVYEENIMPVPKAGNPPIISVRERPTGPIFGPNASYTACLMLMRRKLLLSDNSKTDTVISEREKKYLFEKLNYDQWLFYDIKYDFASAGHFHYHKHSLNGRATIDVQPVFSELSLGKTHGFTASDIKKLRMLYNYIVSKRENAVPECDKLFRPGQDFSKRVRQKPEIKPRKKPNKYLGLPEDQHNNQKDIITGNENDVEDKSDDDSKGDEHNEEDKSDDDRKEDEHNVEDKNYDARGDDNKSAEEVNSKPHNRTHKTGIKLHLKSDPNMKGKDRPKKKADPLSYLSDYLTGDDRRRIEKKRKN